MTHAPTIGVLALQGDVREHLAMLASAGAHGVPVRRPAELARVAGLIIPGGESTTIVKLAGLFDLLDPIRDRIAGGLPTYGSCAGMILLAERIANPAHGAGGVQGSFGGIDMTVRRNAFGRQVESFEEQVSMAGLRGGPLTAVFIRAPWVEEVGPDAEVLARVEAGPATGRIVGIRQRHLLATSFHPELTHDARVHGYFVDMVREYLRQDELSACAKTDVYRGEDS